MKKKGCTFAKAKRLLQWSGVWNLAKKKILLFAEIIAYLHVAMILQTTKRQKLITIRQNKLKAVDLSIATEGKFTRLKRFRE
ncbi:MAG: hypothetical protein J6T33_01485 [Bacteroidales bacterium]|nr:hypothetical protein [Bacteroidales bacterium]